MKLSNPESEKLRNQFILNRDAWAWEAENRTFNKSEWPKQFSDLFWLECDCAFCEYFIADCNTCPLGKALKICGGVRSSYDRWENEYDIEGAKEILDFYDKFIKEMDEKGWDTFICKKDKARLLVRLNYLSD